MSGGTRREELEAQGWKHCSTYDEPRLSELAEAYREIGLEVHLEPFHPGEAPGCSACFREAPEKFFTIYTRGRE